MSDIETEMAKVHQEIATHNSKAAVRVSSETKQELHKQVDRLNFMVNTLTQKVNDLDRKYNLLLSERFNTGPTDGN
jgi:predicted site-specific integrase-resolvase